MILTPAEQYLAATLGVSEDEYILFKTEVEKATKIEPAKPQAGIETLLTISLISTLLSVGFAIAASFFKPKGNKGGAPEIKNTVSEAINRNLNQRFVPRTGFDSSQTPVTLGETIPVIYTKQTFNGEGLPPERRPGVYGGLRFDMLLLWSQMVTLEGSVMFRGVFALSEGDIQEIDLTSFAIGDNLLSGYELQQTATSRASIYFKPDTGRITSADWLTGRSPSSDPGNSELGGGPDVFCINTPGSPVPTPEYCYVSKPNTQTVFGLYSHVPNSFGLRLSVRLRPSMNVQTKALGGRSTRFRAEVVDDAQALADMWKGKYMYSRRMGIESISTGGPVINEGATFEYVIRQESDLRTSIFFDIFNTNALFVTNPQGFPPPGISVLSDVASSVAAQQRTVADSLNIGEVYMCGTALAVLVSKTPNNAPFVSDADNEPYGGGRTIRYTFRCIRAGILTTSSAEYLNPSYTGTLIRPPFYFIFFDFATLTDKVFWSTASTAPQIFKIATASVRVPRETDVIDLGIRSTIGIRANSVTNYKDTLPLFWINFNAGSRYYGFTFDSDASLFTTTSTTGTVSTNETRYSFWQVYLKNSGSGVYSVIPDLIGVRGNSGEAVYNYLTLQMPYIAYWDIKIEPVPSYAVRNLSSGKRLIVLDAMLQSTVTLGVTVPLIGYVLIRWNGIVLGTVGAPSFSSHIFRLSTIEPLVNLLRFTEGTSMFGEWMGLDEACVYDEVSTTVGSSPEHEIVHLNNVTRNDVYHDPTNPYNPWPKLVPQYDDISKVGINIASSVEWQQFSQFSVYVTQGRAVRTLLFGDDIRPSNLFPDIFRDLLTNKRFGAGNIVSDLNIDVQSFYDAAVMNNLNFYFFDGAITDRTNLRQWGAEVAPHYLLELLQIEGQFALKPLLPPRDAPIPIAGLFNAGNIKGDSFSLEFIDDEDRQPIAVNVKYRGSRETSLLYSTVALSGFPEEVQIYVREADTPDNTPVETIDLSDYCTNPWHAIDVACAFIRIRRLITHKIKFTTGLGGIDKPISAGSYIKVPVDYTSYNEFNSGIILADGLVIMSNAEAVADGTYNVLAWDYTEADVVTLTITVTGGYADVTSRLISMPNTTTQENVYKIESIVIDDEGGVVIEAVHSPVDVNGFSLLTRNWTTYKNDSNWVVEPGFATQSTPPIDMPD